MRNKFGREFIEKELKRIGKELEKPLITYLIGGGAMAFQDMKEATKDIDIVVTSGKDFRRLENVLKQTGYSGIKELEEEYEELGAQKILENPNGCRFDIFNQQIVDKLIFSTSMQERSKYLGLEENLQVKLTSSEDIFLFKCVAGRTTDIEDMNTLIQTGLNFETIKKEIDKQVELLGQELFITHITESLENLEEKYETTTPLPELLNEKINKIYDQIEILNELKEETKIKDVKKNVKMPKPRFQRALERLKNKNKIKIENNKIKEIQNKVI